MTLTLGMILTADASGAKAQVAALTGELGKLKDATTAAGAEATTTAAAERAFGASAATAASDVHALSAAQALASAEALSLERASGKAAGGVGNLASTFSLMGTAGTVLQQVAAGILTIFNPTNMLIAAATAAGAATVAWLTGGSEEAKTFGDNVDDLVSATEAYIDASGRARASASEMTAEYGRQADAVRQLMREEAEREKRKVLRETQALSSTLKTDIANGEAGTLRNLFDANSLGEEFRATVREVAAAMAELGKAGTLDAQLAAAQSLHAAFKDAAEASGEITQEEDAILQRLGQAIIALSAVKQETFETAGATKGIDDGLRDAQGSAGTLGEIIGAMLADMDALSGADISGVFARAQGPANALLGTVNGIIGRMATMATMAALRSVQQGLADKGDVYSGRGGDPRTSNRQGYDRFVYNGPALDTFNNPVVNSGGGTGGGRGGGGASAARAEADAVGDLIAKMERELEILREQDPVQKELIRMRDQLKGATEAERQTVEELLAARIRETDIAKGLTETWDLLGDTAYDALTGMALQGKTAGEVLDNLVKSLAQAALQALILGEGPLASLFGTKGTGVVDLLVGAVTGKAAAAPVAAAQKGLNIATALPKAMAAQAAVQSQAANAGNAPGTLREIRVVIDGARGNREIEDAVRAGVSAGIKTYDREALPSRVRAVSGSGRRVG